MHPDSDLPGSPWPGGLPDTDKKRLITNCQNEWRRTKILATILETALWISAIVGWVGMTYLCRLNP
jgi:hypothetical protein